MKYHFISYLGEWGPCILLFVGMLALYKTPTYLGLFVTGSVLNILINYILKGVLKQPRPNEKEHLINLEQRYKEILNFGRYGMPSGHAQSAIFSTAFVFMVTRNVRLLVLFSSITLVTMYQRVKEDFHSPNQVIVGAALGYLVALLFFLYTSKTLQGKVKAKPDDNYFGLI